MKHFDLEYVCGFIHGAGVQISLKRFKNVPRAKICITGGELLKAQVKVMATWVYLKKVLWLLGKQMKPSLPTLNEQLRALC